MSFFCGSTKFGWQVCSFLWIPKKLLIPTTVKKHILSFGISVAASIAVRQCTINIQSKDFQNAHVIKMTKHIWFCFTTFLCIHHSPFNWLNAYVNFKAIAVKLRVKWLVCSHCIKPTCMNWEYWWPVIRIVNNIYCHILFEIVFVLSQTRRWFAIQPLPPPDPNGEARGCNAKKQKWYIGGIGFDTPFIKTGRPPAHVHDFRRPCWMVIATGSQEQQSTLKCMCLWTVWYIFMHMTNI